MPESSSRAWPLLAWGTTARATAYHPAVIPANAAAGIPATIRKSFKGTY